MLFLSIPELAERIQRVSVSTLRSILGRPQYREHERNSYCNYQNHRTMVYEISTEFLNKFIPDLKKVKIRKAKTTKVNWVYILKKITQEN